MPSGIVFTAFPQTRGSTSRHTRTLLALAACLFIFLFLAASPVSARQNGEEEARASSADTLKTITAVRISSGDVGAGTAGGGGSGTAAKIDGVLDEPFWQYAPRSGGFVQAQPDEGEPATESTFVRVVYDDDALYIGMEMYDSEPDKIVNRLTRRDRWLEADIVHIMIDSHHDHLTACCFSVYSSGTQRDVYYYNDTWTDESWDAVWESGTQITDWGWTAEVRIPFHCLRFSTKKNGDGGSSLVALGADNPGADAGLTVGNPTAAGLGSDPAQLNAQGSPGRTSSFARTSVNSVHDGYVWGIYFSRNVCRKNELGRWNYIPLSAGGFVSKFGHLVGVRNIRPPKRLEILPYGVSYAEAEPESPGNPDGRDYTHNAGFDVKYGLTSNITLNATINPDFGQVEADQTILNLSTFETWYPEKRPFFIEGNTIFNTYYTLFYSRRIGRPPSIWPDDVDYYTNRPSATTILGAAKITGRTDGGMTIGVLEAATEREEATYRDEYGALKTAVIEPEANYLVTRVKQDIMRNSSVGLMATAVNQKHSDAHYTGGADWNLRFHEGDYQVNGQVVASKTGPEEDGWGGLAVLEKSGGENLVGSMTFQYRDRGLNLNRIGFLDRPNYKEFWGWFQFKTNKKWWIVRKSWNNLNLGYSSNLDDVGLVRGGNFNNSIQLTNFWEVGGGSWVDYDRTYSDYETRGGPPAPIPIGKNWWLWLSTDRRKWYGLFGQVGGGDTYDGHYNEYITELTLQPRSNIELTASPRYRTHWGVSRWLTYLTDSEGNRTDDIFGEQRLHRVDLTFRGTFTFTRDLTLQFYAQPFFAAVEYSNFKRLLPPDSFEPVDSSVYDPEVEQPNFNWTSFNSNLILRWQYRPGSALYLVWTQARESTRSIGDFDFGRDWDQLFGTRAGNTFLVKVSYWWSL